MRLPAGYEQMTDEEFLQALTAQYQDGETAQFVFDVIRGKESLEFPLE